MKKEIKNTNQKFYENWSREQLIKELCRLNQLLLDSLKIIKKIQEALIWCSGSEDFQDYGKARKGWLKICKPLLNPQNTNPKVGGIIT